MPSRKHKFGSEQLEFRPPKIVVDKIQNDFLTVGSFGQVVLDGRSRPGLSRRILNRPAPNGGKNFYE